MPTRADIVAEARCWLDTPFHHQARVRGVGVDCVGLVVGVARACGLDVRDRAGYGRTPHGGALGRALAEQLVAIPLAAALPGDVLELAWRDGGESMHVGWLTDHGLLHATETLGRVVEHRIDEVWQGRVRGAWRVPGVEG